MPTPYYIRLPKDLAALPRPNEYASSEFVGSFWTLDPVLPRFKDMSSFSKKFHGLVSKASDRCKSHHADVIKTCQARVDECFSTALCEMTQQLSSDLESFVTKVVQALKNKESPDAVAALVAHPLKIISGSTDIWKALAGFVFFESWSYNRPWPVQSRTSGW